MHIGERIKKARLKRAWTQRDLARHAQVNHAWIAKLESGDRHNISLEAGARVAVALGMTLDYLAGITKRMAPLEPGEAPDEEPVV